MINKNTFILCHQGIHVPAGLFCRKVNNVTEIYNTIAR